MGELGNFFRMQRAGFPLVLIECPTGAWTFRGTVPVKLCDWKDGAFAQYVPRVYKSKEEALAAADAIGAKVQE